jgi:hypothetical protein
MLSQVRQVPRYARIFSDVKTLATNGLLFLKISGDRDIAAQICLCFF